MAFFLRSSGGLKVQRVLTTLFIVILIQTLLFYATYTFLSSQVVSNTPQTCDRVSTTQLRATVSAQTADIAKQSAQVHHEWGSILDPHNLHVGPFLSEEKYKFKNLSYAKITHKKVKPRVCFVTSEFVGLGSVHGGIGTAFFELSKLLASNDFNVTVLYLGSIGENRLRMYTDLPITTIQLPDYPLQISPNWFASLNFRILQFFLNHENDFDIVHFHEWAGYGYNSMIAKKQGWAFQSTTFIAGLHGPEFWASLASRRYPGKESLEMSFYEQKTIELADVVVAPSLYILQYIISHGWKVPERSYVIQNVISPPDDPIISVHTAAIRELVFFGRLESRKGVELFLEALDIIAKEKMIERRTDDKIVLPWKITFLGRDIKEPGIGSVKKWIQKTHIASNWSPTQLKFITLDRAAALEYLQDQSKLVVIPSLAENSPFTVLECILYKIRFLASDVGGISELIHKDDRSKVIFRALPKYLAMKLKEEINVKSKAAIRPAVQVNETASQWLSLHNYILSNHKQYISKPRENAVSNPSVTICVTHHNRPLLLKQLLSALSKQDYLTFETIIVDDSSSPENREHLQEILHEWTSPNQKFFMVDYSYTGYARNYCYRQSSDSKYLLFLDDDDIPKPNMISKLALIAEYTGAEILTSFFEVFKSEHNPLINKALKSDHIYAFAGSSQSLGFVGNYLGGAPMFIQKDTFGRLNGFTEYQNVGYEDYEFLVRAAIEGVTQQIVPDPLLYVRNTAGSISKRDNKFLSEFRALLPYLNHPDYAPLSDLFLFTKKLIRDREQPPSTAAANSKTSYGGYQGVDGWYYGFRAIGSTKFDTSNAFFNPESSSWSLSGSPFHWPYISNVAMHPIYSVEHNVKYAPVRRWVSYKDGKASLKIYFEKLHVPGCGNGLLGLVEVDGKQVWEYRDDRGIPVSTDIDVELRVGMTVDLVLDPLDNDQCDGAVFTLEIVMEK